jgi:hypothetical protein
MIDYAFHKRSSGGSVRLLGIFYILPIRTNDPYLGIYWVFPEDSPPFPECHPKTSILFHKTKNGDSKSLSDSFYGRLWNSYLLYLYFRDILILTILSSQFSTLQHFYTNCNYFTYCLLGDALPGQSIHQKPREI